MKKLLLLVVMVALSFTGFTFAHPGNTDDYGCHTCYTNCSSWGLLYGQYHCHSDTVITPTSYVGYAPDGSCPDEKNNLNVIQNKIDSYEIEITKIENETKEKYAGSQIQDGLLAAIIAEATENLSREQTYEVIKSNTAFNMYNSCLNSVGLKAYSELLKQRQEKNIENQNNLLCIGSFGPNSKSDDKGNCICKEGYQFNTAMTWCDTIIVTNSNTKSNSQITNTDELINAISWLYNNEMTIYSTIDKFMPDDNLTREQASKFFVSFSKKILGKTVDTNKLVSLNDLKQADKTLQGHIKEANQLGLFNGIKGKFLPFNKLTRAQTLAVIIRSINGKQDEIGAKRYDKYYTLANVYKLLDGLWFDYTTLDSINIKRGDVALLLYRLGKIISQKRICQYQYGEYSYGDGTFDRDGIYNCYCNTGYTINDNATKCVKFIN